MPRRVYILDGQPRKPKPQKIRPRAIPPKQNPVDEPFEVKCKPPDCPECGAPMELRLSKFQNRRMYWGCPVRGCHGSHGAQPDGTPLGKPARGVTKKMRIAAHAEFDKLWKTGKMSRSEAYTWMQKALGLSKEDAHIANFNSETCAILIRKVWAKLEPDDDSILPDEWR